MVYFTVYSCLGLCEMKSLLERTKVVLRHLPASFSEPALMEQIDGKFSGRYKWFCFRLVKDSQKNQRYSRAYIDFKNPEDVFDFAEFFDGHVFVNEKGTQFKVQVEYAPSQCVPKPWTKKDSREGTIFKDPEYLEFLELLTRPAENLPSADIQLERREAERAGPAKEVLVVTPLMDFVRQKRAAKNGPQVNLQRTPGNGKPSRRTLFTGNSLSPSSKRRSEKRRGSALMNVSKESASNESCKVKQTCILVPRRDERLSEKPTDRPSSCRKEDTQGETGTGLDGMVSRVPISVEMRKKTLLLLKAKERASSYDASSQIRNLQGSTSFKQIQQLEASGRVIRSILSNKERHQVLTSQSDTQLVNGNKEREKCPPRPPLTPPNSKERSSGLFNSSASDGDGKLLPDEQVDSNESHVFISDNKHDKRLRNKDRPDRSVWAPLRRSDGSHGRGNKLLSTNEIPFTHDVKHDSPNRDSEFRGLGVERMSHTLDNGTQRHVGRRGSNYGSKELDSPTTIAEGKPLKKGPCYGSYEIMFHRNKCGFRSPVLLHDLPLRILS
ncbi:regulator of nonsense transcripts UPF3-like isoform X2 [Phalaenopsis equestris]|uniref:regulator of nonsense transcripts UPF3-like isoform X2 n=1 Tax=Phalaenopsis equestris TaxID=78828 RepID=UPI0009E38A61|nr:regulator of nonsense transcripts UPF3-like isoform X2 [Phalaenopsis equestris]